ncbi:MAG: hypothetical protein QOH83_1393 [Solirubrobacteraceae bacterium]|nr:hypothetical protein [Solirubrobacteraceae bacterium]
MLDLTGLPALDVAIGLAFIFFLLATLALTIQEFIAAILGLRARTLEQGLRSMLEDPKDGWKYVDRFYDHALITSLYRTPPPDVVVKNTKRRRDVGATPAGRNARTQSRGALARAWAFFKRTRGPSYISPRSFALVVLDNFAPDDGQKTFFDRGTDAVEELPVGLRKRIKPLIGGPQKDVENLRTNLEAWYDDTMARVSGWYKRKTQIIVIVIGVLLVPAINANTIAMAQRMWKGDTVRAAVLVQARADASAKPPAGETPTADQKLTNAADSVDKVGKVGIPMGWRGAAVPHGVEGIATAVVGWLLTILAISLGAPFWFDLLSRFSRLRSSGKPETPLPAAGSNKANERILTPPQTPTLVLEQHVLPASGTIEPGSDRLE